MTSARKKVGPTTEGVSRSEPEGVSSRDRIHALAYAHLEHAHLALACASPQHCQRAVATTRRRRPQQRTVARSSPPPGLPSSRARAGLTGGDLGSISADATGVAKGVITSHQVKLSGLYSVVGRSMTVHAGPDVSDLGIACGEIKLAEC